MRVFFGAFGTSDEDRFQHGIRLLKDVVIPEAEDCPAETFQETRALRISRITMLTAIRFHDQTRFSASEVRDVTANRYLTPELEAADISVAQMVPEAALCVRCVASQLP